MIPDLSQAQLKSLTAAEIEMTHAFIYQPSRFRANIKKMIDLGTLGGNDSYGMAINANNHVVGYSTVNIERVHAFLYDGRKMRDLGSLGGVGGSGTDQSMPWGSTSSIKWSVGVISRFQRRRPIVAACHSRQAAFIYSQGVMMDLNGLIGPEAAKHYWLRAATAINNNGQIVAIAEDLSTNEIHAVLLTR